MKYYIRHGVFETNSSSSHSVTIAKTADDHAVFEHGNELIAIVRSFEAKCRFIADAVTCAGRKDAENMWTLIEIVRDIYAEKTGKPLDMPHLKQIKKNEKCSYYDYEAKCADYFNNHPLNDGYGCQLNCYEGILNELKLEPKADKSVIRQKLTELLTGDYDFLLYEGWCGGEWSKVWEIY